MEIINVETLRTWLEERRPVTILDVRTAADRAEWWIPGSMHVDAYAALKAHDPTALAAVELPDHDPIVTVCIAGYTSRIAAEQLAWRGINALSLDGGMRAWSLSWNTAGVPCSRGDARIIQVRRTGKGCLSYVVGSGAEAIVIDAALDPQVYLNLAKRHGWRIVGVFDTHIHADHLSRSRQLARLSGAVHFLPDQQRASFPFVPVHDCDMLAIAGLSLTVLHTPGHTSESVCYLLNERVLFTGDTHTLSGVGRPDQNAAVGEAQERASRLYFSLHRLLTLPSETLVLPAHTGTPVAFDDQSISAPLASVEKRVDIMHAGHDTFVRTILQHIPATPLNYELVTRFNEKGVLPEDNVTDLEAGANRCAVA